MPFSSAAPNKAAERHGFLAAGLLVIALTAWQAAAAPPTGTAKAAVTVTAREVKCPRDARAAEACTVSARLYLGWRGFHTHCYQCHGGSGLGSTFAPNLLERFKTRVDHARFRVVMQEGYVGQVGAMPSFARNPAVQKDKDAIYAYLLARTQGLLPPGRPRKQP